MFSDLMHSLKMGYLSRQYDIAYITSFICLLIFMGLFYQVAWQYPVNDSFPLIERILDSNFLANDFYTNTFTEFSPRLMLSQEIAAISQLTGIHYTEVIAALNIIRIWLYGLALYYLFLTLTDKNTALVAFSFSALSFLTVPFLPAWWPISYDLTSSNIALVFSMLAWGLTLNNRINSTFIILAISVYFHPLVGLHGFLLSMLIYISFNGFQAFLALLRQPLIYLSGAIYGAVFLSIYLSFEQVISDQRFIAINGEFRHAHHYFLEHMEIEKWISTIALVALSFLITLKINFSKKVSNTIYATMGFSAIMVALGYLFVELYPTRFMYSLIPMRTFPILVPMIVLSIAALAVHKYNKQDYVSFFVLFTPFIPYNHLGLTWYLLPNYHEVILPTIVAIIAVGIATITELKPDILKPLNSFLLRIFKKDNISFSILPISVLSLILAITRFEIEIPTLQNEANIYQWLNTNSSSNDIIVSELNAASNQKIRLIAHRAVVVSKDFPFNETFYEQWYQRYSQIYVERDQARGRIDSLSPAELNQLMDQYSATILLRTKPLEENIYFSPIGSTMGENAMSYIYRNNEEIAHGY